jgi:hypothetical protein
LLAGVRDADKLERRLAGPAAPVPGAQMPVHIPDAAMRRDILAYRSETRKGSRRKGCGGASGSGKLAFAFFLSPTAVGWRHVPSSGLAWTRLLRILLTGPPALDLSPNWDLIGSR